MTLPPDPAILLPLSIALPLAAALVVVLFGAHVGRQAGWTVLASAVGSVGALLWLTLECGDTPHQFVISWLPAIDVALALRGDGFGLFFALLVSSVGTLVIIYSLGYMAGERPDRVRRYYAALAGFMGAMLGIALADDLILLFVFWELTSITSFLLIGFRSDDESARGGALTALLVTALGGLVMSVGFLLVGQITGTFSLSTITADRDLITKLLASPLADAALLLILCGAFTKSAQVPFHFWLPRAMVAPTPISAYLHAATMVKAGVYLVGRMLPLFGSSPLWTPVVVTVGATTMVLGAYQALWETDLKAILARTTASALGMMMLLYGLGTAEQDALQMLNHALYKGALFLVAGIVEHHAHTRDLNQLGGLRRALPLPFLACALGALSMAGIPPLLGFLAKESFYTVVLEGFGREGALVHLFLVGTCVVSSALLAAVAWKFTAGVFLDRVPPVGARHRDAYDGHPVFPPLSIAPVILAVTSLVLGLLGATRLTGDLAAAASSRPDAHLHVSLFPGLHAPLAASLAAIGLAAVLYRGRRRLAALRQRLVTVPTAEAVWERLLNAVVRVAEAYSQRWQNGSLRWYLAATVFALPLLFFYALHTGGLSYRLISFSIAEMSWYGLLLCALLSVTTIAVVRARSRLAAAIGTTTVGFLVSMLFVVYRSPDILLTQILIETVSTIFIVLVLVFLPAFRPRDLTPTARALNFAVAGAVGLMVTLMLLLTMTPGFRELDNISTRPGGLLALSLAEGGGANAVNVIIVDIRAMDTNGEITVLVVVGLCIYGLLRSRRRSA